MSKSKKKYYAVFQGRKPGIYTEWYGADGAEVQVRGFTGALFKGFSTSVEASVAMEQFKKNQAQFDLFPPKKSTKTAPPAPSIDISKAIIIYTDGGCINNPGPGGYGIVILNGKQRKEISGGFRLTTNNRMELLASILALKEAPPGASVLLHTDSQYVVNGITKGWAKRWQENNWMRNKLDRAENADLWEQLLQLVDGLLVRFQWVKGHAGNKENERCDELATAAARSNASKLLSDTFYEENHSFLA